MRRIHKLSSPRHNARSNLVARTTPSTPPTKREATTPWYPPHPTRCTVLKSCSSCGGTGVSDMRVEYVLKDGTTASVDPAVTSIVYANGTYRGGWKSDWNVDSFRYVVKRCPHCRGKGIVFGGKEIDKATTPRLGRYSRSRSSR